MGHIVCLVLLRSPVRYASLAPLAAVARYMRATSSRCAPAARAQPPLRAARKAAVARNMRAASGRQQVPLGAMVPPTSHAAASARTYIGLLEGFITQKRSKLGKDSRIYSIFSGFRV